MNAGDLHVHIEMCIKPFFKKANIYKRFTKIFCVFVPLSSLIRETERPISRIRVKGSI